MTAPLTGSDRAAALADIHRARVLHEAGHAVAAVACGATVHRFVVPFDDFTSSPGPVAYVRHDTRWDDQAFVAWAGLYASALVMVDAGEYDDVMEALDNAVATYDGEAGLTPGLTGDVDEVTDRWGIDPTRPPTDWVETMDSLWPAAKAVADNFLTTGHVDTGVVRDAMDALDL